MNETWLGHIAIGMWVATVFLDVTTMVTQGVPLQQFAAVGKMTLLVAPMASVHYAPITSDPCLSNKPLTLQYLCRGKSSRASIFKDEGALDGVAELLVTVCPCDSLQTVLVLVFVPIHRGMESDQSIRSLFVFLVKVLGPMHFSGEHHVMFITYCPADDGQVFLVWFKEPFLVRSEGCAIFLVGMSVEWAGENIVVEAHAGFKEGARIFNAIVDERGQCLATLSIRDCEEMVGSMREVLQAVVKILFPTGARMDAGLGLPVFLVTIKPF
jgi:hypothetical protein